MSASKLASAIDIRRESIEALEVGHLDPSYELLLAVADGLGAQPSALVTLAEQLEQANEP